MRERAQNAVQDSLNESSVRPNGTPIMPISSFHFFDEVAQESVRVPQESILVPQESILVPQESILVPQESILVPQELILVPTDVRVFPDGSNGRASVPGHAKSLKKHEF